MKDSLKISFSSHPKYLSVVRMVTAKIAEQCGFEKKIVEEIRLAVDEACANVIKHAYKGDTSKEIVLEYTNTEKEFTVILEDKGTKADIRSIKGRDLEKVRPGGLGVHFIRRVFDVFEYDEKRTEGNRLVLRKYLGSEQ